jgi:mono/diheme cytochrome c family protein
MPWTGSGTPTLRVLRTLILCLPAVFLLACRGDGDRKEFSFADLPATPAAHREGEQLFNANCSSCHGLKGAGTLTGPPLVHIIYEPNHHGDASFQLAVQRGVVAHHWRFGNMPPVPGVTPDQTTLITSYIRWVQRQAGIQ